VDNLTIAVNLSTGLSREFFGISARIQKNGQKKARISPGLGWWR
jgi:hypothetical protein